MALADTFPVGSWKAMAATSENNGNPQASAVVLLRISPLSAAAATPNTRVPSQPLPPTGTTTRSYLAHPSAMRVLQARFAGVQPDHSHLSSKQVFQKAGFPQGAWNITWFGTESTFVVTGDVEIHKLFKQLPGKLSWEEFLKN